MPAVLGLERPSPLASLLHDPGVDLFVVVQASNGAGPGGVWIVCECTIWELGRCGRSRRLLARDLFDARDRLVDLLRREAVDNDAESGCYTSLRLNLNTVFD